MKSLNKIPNTQCYQHNFGVVHVEGWNNGKPFLVLTENSYYESGESWGYNYFKLDTIETIEQAQALAAELRANYNMPMFYDGNASVELLRELHAKFPNSNIQFNS